MTFAAAALALYIAFSLDLPRPYWAATTVYIVAQPSAGALRAKGLWRFYGTLVGAAFAVLMVPNLVDAPVLLILVFALWIGFCLIASLRDPTPRSYGFMLAGYTAAIIGFPSVEAPAAIFDTAVSRVEEISIGIACVTILHSILLPQPAAAQLVRGMHAYVAEMARFGIDTLSGRDNAAAFFADRRRLARDGAALDAISHQVWYEKSSRDTMFWLPTLRGKARQVPAILTAAADRIATLRVIDPAAPKALSPLLTDVAAWMAQSSEAAPQGGMDPTARGLLARLEHEQEHAAAAGDWSGLVREGLLVRLQELIETWADCLDLSRRIITAQPPEPEPQQDLPLRPPGHVDPLMVLLSGLAAALAVIVCSAFWILTAWPDGAAAAMMAAIGASIFAHLDDPAPAITSFIIGTAMAVLVAAIYLFVVLPAIDGFPLLIFALGVFFLPIGAFQTVPNLAPLLMPITLSSFAVMSLQETYAADFSTFLSSGIATLAGSAFALWATRLIRSFGVALRVSRLIQADQRDLARLAEGRHSADLRHILATMLDRFEAVASRLGAADAGTIGTRELAELRAALNVVRLREITSRLDSRSRILAEDALSAVAAHARGREPPERTLARLDAALAVVTGFADRLTRLAAQSLAGLRMALFPEAPPPALAPGPVAPSDQPPAGPAAAVA